MASFKTSNPHSKMVRSGECKRFYMLPKDTHPPKVENMWKDCSGDAVEDDSKRFLAVVVDQKEFILADIRLVGLKDLPGGPRVVLEFFFDGETDDIASRQSKESFISGLQGRVSWCIDEYYRRVIQTSAASRGSLSSLRSLERLDDIVQPVGDKIEDAFRDAGCMLRFVAVRVSLTPVCAFCIGCMVFPEHFGVVPVSSTFDKRDPLPSWIIAMGISTLVIGVAMVYAWIQILVYGNSRIS